MSLLYTENLILRKFNVSDLQQYYKNNQDAEIQKFMSYRYYSDKKKARADLENSISNYSSGLFPYNLAIVKTDIDKLIGHIGIGILDINETEKGYELEYAISSEYRGLHYGTEALRAFVPWCKAEFNIDRIYASVSQHNAASCKSLINAGFTLFEGEFDKRSTTDIYIY